LKKTTILTVKFLVILGWVFCIRVILQKNFVGLLFLVAKVQKTTLVEHKKTQKNMLPFGPIVSCTSLSKDEVVWSE
jgi:hypothetical protein